MICGLLVLLLLWGADAIQAPGGTPLVFEDALPYSAPFVPVGQLDPGFSSSFARPVVDGYPMPFSFTNEQITFDLRAVPCEKSSLYGLYLSLTLDAVSVPEDVSYYFYAMLEVVRGQPKVTESVLLPRRSYFTYLPCSALDPPVALHIITSPPTNFTLSGTLRVGSALVISTESSRPNVGSTLATPLSPAVSVLAFTSHSEAILVDLNGLASFFICSSIPPFDQLASTCSEVHSTRVLVKGDSRDSTALVGTSETTATVDVAGVAVHWIPRGPSVIGAKPYRSRVYATGFAEGVLDTPGANLGTILLLEIGDVSDSYTLCAASDWDPHPVAQGSTQLCDYGDFSLKKGATSQLLPLVKKSPAVFLSVDNTGQHGLGASGSSTVTSNIVTVDAHVLSLCDEERVTVHLPIQEGHTTLLFIVIEDLDDDTLAVAVGHTDGVLTGMWQQFSDDLRALPLPSGATAVKRTVPFFADGTRILETPLDRDSSYLVVGVSVKGIEHPVKTTASAELTISRHSHWAKLTPGSVTSLHDVTSSVAHRFRFESTKVHKVVLSACFGTATFRISQDMFLGTIVDELRVKAADQHAVEDTLSIDLKNVKFGDVQFGGGDTDKHRALLFVGDPRPRLHSANISATISPDGHGLQILFMRSPSRGVEYTAFTMGSEVVTAGWSPHSACGMAGAGTQLVPWTASADLEIAGDFVALRADSSLPVGREAPFVTVVARYTRRPELMRSYLAVEPCYGRTSSSVYAVLVTMGCGILILAALGVGLMFGRRKKFSVRVEEGLVDPLAPLDELRERSKRSDEAQFWFRHIVSAERSVKL